MKKITKNDEPQFFIDWKNQYSPRFWEELQNPEKGQLRENLVEEQGYICCYCNRAIKADHRTHIEHLLPQQKYKTKIFEYNNLLASCDGGERDQPPRMIHCDAQKDDKLLPVTPLDENCETDFRFLISGEILAQNNSTDAQQTIEILGLNIPKLTQDRRAAIEAYLDVIEHQSKDKDDIQREIELMNQKSDGKFAPFCSAIVYVLRGIIS